MLILHVFNKLVNSLLLNNRGSRGLMIIESWTRNTKVASLSLGPAGIVGGGECTALSPPSTPRPRCP